MGHTIARIKRNKIMKKKKILVSGSLGFIFSNFVRQVVDQYPEYIFVGIDKAVKEYNLDNSFTHPNYTFYFADIADEHILDRIFKIEKPDYIINGCAESHVDNSISDIMPFLHSNIIGTQTLINMALKYNVEKFLHISTDEVLGQKLNIDDEPWTEESPILSRNPYACTKASAELIVKAAHYTHNLQFLISRGCNVFGPRQKKENLIPHILNSLIENKQINIHGNGLNFRQYIFVNDKIDGIMKIIKNGKINEIYNISDDNYFTNLDMVHYLSKQLNKDPKINFIEDRKAHDFGYKVSNSKLKSLGWSPKNNFDNAMKQTINWYINNYG